MAKAKLQILTLAAIEAMTPADRILYYKNTVITPFAAIDKARNAATGNLHNAAKSVAAMKRLYVVRLNAHEIGADTTFKEFLKANGGEVPARVQSLAGLFNALVLTVDGNGKPILTEEFFDKTSVASLEKCAGILKAVKADCKETGADYRFHQAVLDMVNVLNDPSEETPKKLVDIRKSLKPETTDGETADGDAPLLTVGRAVEFLKATIKNAGKLPAAEGRALYYAVIELGDAFAESGVETDTLNEWAEQKDANVAPHMEVVKVAA